jgi:hypothetical protein
VKSMFDEVMTLKDKVKVLEKEKTRISVLKERIMILDKGRFVSMEENTLLTDQLSHVNKD